MSAFNSSSAFAATVASELSAAASESFPWQTQHDTSPPAAESMTGPPPMLVTDSAPSGYQRPDMLIVDDIARSLAEAADVEASEVELACSEGLVIVAGSVPRVRDRARVEAIVTETFGVVDLDLTGLAVERHVDLPDEATLREASKGTSHEVTTADHTEATPLVHRSREPE